MDHLARTTNDPELSQGASGRPTWRPPAINHLRVASIAGGANPFPTEAATTCFPSGS